MKISIRTVFILFAFILAFACSECLSADQQGFVKPKPLSKAELEEIKRATDWDDIPVITNRKEYVEYLNDCLKERMSVIPVAFGKEFRVDPKNGGRAAGDKSLPLYVHWWRYQVIEDGGDGGCVKAVYQVLYYPGLRIADAYLKNDTSKLTEDELKVYNKVLPIVNQAKRMRNDLDKEWHVHKAIIRSAEYKLVDLQKEKTLRNISALGIFLDGSGNCQAFSDAFYMLAKMLGFNVGFCTGMAGGGLHIWNTIELDKKIYYVDVTWDDPFKEDNPNKDKLVNYIYFIAPREVITQTHSWNDGYDIGDVQEDIDDKYFYTTDEYTDFNEQYYSLEDDDAMSGLVEIANGIANEGAKRCFLMIPYNKQFSIANNVIKFLDKELHKLGWRGRFYVHISSNPKWKYMFYTIVLN